MLRASPMNCGWNSKENAMKRFFHIALVIGVLLFLSMNCEQPAKSTSHDDAFSNDNLLTVGASDLKQTVVEATLTAPMEQGKNVLWCGTFQLAWNETSA